MGFSRWGAGCHLPCAGRDTLSRIAFPMAMRSSTLGPKIWLPSLEPWGDVRVFGFFAALMLGFIETSSDGTAAFEFKGAAFSSASLSLPHITIAFERNSNKKN